MSDDPVIGDTGGLTDSYTRRKLLATCGIAGSAMVSGCIGMFNEEQEDDQVDVGDISTDEIEQVDGQKFLTPLPGDVHPDDVTFLGTGPFPFVIDFGASFWHPFHDIPSYMNEPGLWGPWMNEGVTDDTVHYGCYENVDISDDEITVDIRSDQTWANGDTVTARDVFTILVGHRMNLASTGIRPVYEIVEEGFDPTENFTITAITDFERSEKSLTMISEGGHFAEYDKPTLYELTLLPENIIAGYHSNTKVGFNKPWAEKVWNHWEKAKAGEVDPWLNTDEAVENVTKEVLNADTDEAMNRHREPDVALGHGAWTLKEIEGSQAVVLEPNEHWRHADLVNYDEIRLELAREQRANWAAIQANELDYYTGSMPEDVAAQLPSTHEMTLSESPIGIGMQFRHTYEFFNDVRSRRAFLYIVDQKALVEAEGERFHEPIMKPGGDLWGAEEFFDEEFLDSLRTYDHDPERAEQLLKDVGWTKESGEWYFPSGDRAQLVVPTGAETPRHEVTLVDQLKEFGIEASVQVKDPGVYRADVLKGNHKIHNTQWSLFTGGVGRLADSWQETVAQGMYIKNAFRGLFPVETANEFGFQAHPIYGEGMAQPEPTDEALTERHKAWEIEAPPVGEWDGDLQTYRPVSLAQSVFDQSSLEEVAPTLAWLVNWYVPSFPLANSRDQTTINVSNWIWPGESTSVWHDGDRYVDEPDIVSMTGDLFYANSQNPQA